MRRVAALTLAVALTWIVVGPLGDAGGHSVALSLGIALLAAAITGWLCEFVRLPRVTGYLAVGLICGPAVANLITEPMARDLQAASRFAVVVIAVMAGLHVNLRVLQPRLGGLMRLTAVVLVAAWSLTAVALYAAWPWLPIASELAGVQRFLAIALGATLLVSVSPAVAVAIVTESRARGPFADLSVQVVVLLQLATVVLFMLLLGWARVVFGVESPSPGGLLAGALWSLLGSVAFGALVGGIFALYLQYVGREVTVVLMAVCLVLSQTSEPFGFESFLAGLTAGIVVQTVMGQAGDVLHDAIEYAAMPVLVLFFAAAGASLHVELLATVGVIALVLSGVRLAGWQIGSLVGAKVSGLASGETRLLWRALLPTAGVTLGLASAVASDHAVWGVRLEAIVVAVVAINQLAGPIVFRAALSQAGEIGRSGGGLVVVSNREPWMHDRTPDGIVAKPTPGGVSVALDALMRERGGVWIAHGAGSADRDVVNEHDSVEVPPDAPAYRLRRLWLTDAQVEGYYAGFSNSALWPLCHQAHVRPVFKAEDWDTYRQVNNQFAEAVAQEAPPESSVFLNDYHLALVARGLRRRRPALRTALFWHIPWPDVDRLRICPWRRDILEGLLSNDLLAFQVPRDTRNFLSAVLEELGAPVTGNTVFWEGRATRVVSIPIGADFERISTTLADEATPERMRTLAADLGLEGRIVGVGVDRLDYTKGIPERMAAIGRLLRENPALAGRLTFVQIGVPSREDVPAYAAISAEIDSFVARINSEFGSGPTEGPIKYLKQTFRLPELVALYRLADFCIVSSLHDGMNLVAKEFVAARDDLDGVLILSELAGAAQELPEALIINPYDERGFTAAIARAIEMPVWERHRRMRALRRQVAGRDVLAWASDILDRLERRKGSGFLSG
ncbi:MAG: trehalose-6-phosphate synthase [Acidobacteria bacterium]|nr:trehalose-6-phosphate synthase [Acidobacteriota bacterium]